MPETLKSPSTPLQSRPMRPAKEIMGKTRFCDERSGGIRRDHASFENDLGTDTVISGDDIIGKMIDGKIIISKNRDDSHFLSQTL